MLKDLINVYDFNQLTVLISFNSLHNIILSLHIFIEDSSAFSYGLT